MQIFKIRPLIYTMLLLMLVWTSYITFKHPYLGIGLSQNEQNQWFISEFYKDGIAENAGLELNDIIISINDRKPENHPSAIKFFTIEQAYTVDISRGDTIHNFNFAHSFSSLTFRYAMVLTSALLFFSLAAFTAQRVIHSKTGNSLIATFLTMGIVFLCAEASSREDIASRILVYSFMSAVPFVFAKFIYHFLTQKGYKLYSYERVNAFLWLMIALAVIRIIYFFDLPLHIYHVIDRTVTLLSFSAGCLLVMNLLLAVYLKNRLEYSFSALIVRIVLLAFGSSFIPYLLLAVMPDIIGYPLVSYSRAFWFILLFPLSFVYFAVKYKLVEHTPYIRSLFSPHHHQVLSFNRLLAEYGRTNALNEWEKELFPRFCKVLRLQAIGLHIVDQENVRLYRYGPMEEEELVKAFAKERRPDHLYQIYAIQSKFDLTSHLIIKRELPAKSIGKEQQQCIDVLIAWLSITLENMYLSEKLSLKVENLMTETAAASEQKGEHALWFRKTLYQMQEKERRRIASELHDTVMQDIYFARQRISAIRNSATLPAPTDEQLVELSEYLDVINSSLRDANFQLYPHLLKEVGFTATISNLIEDERVHAPFQLTLRIEQKNEWDRLDSDTHHHLFRIIQELLSNARKHAGAEQVSLHLYIDEHNFMMNYRDDGAGFDLNLEHDGAGLRNILHRTHSLDGTMQVKTALLQGVWLTISLPEKAGYSYEQVY